MSFNEKVPVPKHRGELSWVRLSQLCSGNPQGRYVLLKTSLVCRSCSDIVRAD